MKIIGYVGAESNAVTYYRSKHSFKRLNKIQDKYKFVPLSEIGWDGLGEIDMVFIIRADTSDAYKAIKYCKMMKKPVWIDYDDDLLAVPSDNPNHAHYGQKEIIEYIGKCLQIVDVITFSTDHLRNTYLKGFKDSNIAPPLTATIQNAIDLSLFPMNENMKTHKRVLWRGSATHTMDLMSVANEIPENDYEWHFIGFNPFMMDKKVKYFYHKPMDIIIYMNFIRDLAPEFMITPLVQNQFNKCKSNIAWLEGTYAGAVTIAPELDEFVQPGIINYKDPSHFKNTFLEAIDLKEADRTFLRKRSATHIEDNFCLDKLNQKRIDLLDTFFNDR